MEKLNPQLEEILRERYGKDSIIAVATMKGEIPCVRYVNGFYMDRAFYVITYACSDKMRQIGENPTVAVAAEWFTAHGKGVNLGWFRKEENTEIAEKLREAFADWIDNGHNNFEDENTCILCIKLTDGVLLSHGTQYEIDFE